MSLLFYCFYKVPNSSSTSLRLLMLFRVINSQADFGLPVGSFSVSRSFSRFWVLSSPEFQLVAATQLNCVSCVLKTCSRANLPCVHMCQRALRAQVPKRALRAYGPTHLACLRANVPCVLECSGINVHCVLTCSCPNVSCGLICQRALHAYVLM